LTTAADSLRAYRQMSEGKKSSSGRQTMTPYSPLEAAERAMGFTPGREAEQAEMNSAYYSASNEQKSQRGALINAWITAKPAEKTSAWKAIQKFNASVPKDAKVTQAELSTAKSRRDTEQKRGTVVNGIGVSKRDRYLLKRAQNTYNP
jgi:hypothetical protein